MGNSPALWGETIALVYELHLIGQFNTSTKIVFGNLVFSMEPYKRSKFFSREPIFFSPPTFRRNQIGRVITKIYLFVPKQDHLNFCPLGLWRMSLNFPFDRGPPETQRAGNPPPPQSRISPASTLDTVLMCVFSVQHHAPVVTEIGFHCNRNHFQPCHAKSTFGPCLML